MSESNLCPTCHKPTNESSPYREMQVDTAMVPATQENKLARMIQFDTSVRKSIKKAFVVVVKTSTMLGILVGGSGVAVLGPYYLGKWIGMSLCGLPTPPALVDRFIAWCFGLVALIGSALVVLLVLFALVPFYKKVSNALDDRFPSLRQ